jgi:hypothetical protein
VEVVHLIEERRFGSPIGRGGARPTMVAMRSARVAPVR